MGLVALLRSLREKLLDNEAEDKKSKQSNKQLRDNLKELDSLMNISILDSLILPDQTPISLYSPVVCVDGRVPY